MILVTGSAGKTGQAVISKLIECGLPVRALVKDKQQAEKMENKGIAEAVVGDITAAESYRRAMRGIGAVYHICPNMHPRESEIGRLAVTSARELGVKHFVYHSVLHPQTEKMPHHWQKMRIEEMIFESGLDFTVLQPAPYMQNILAGREMILKKSFYYVPYPVETSLSLVDLPDLGEAAAVVLTEPGHKGAVYEIVGTEALSQLEIASVLGETLKQKVEAEEISLESWRDQAEKNGMDPYQVDTLLKMFEYYARYGLEGNSNVLRWLLGREPHDLKIFASRELAP